MLETVCIGRRHFRKWQKQKETFPADYDSSYSKSSGPPPILDARKQIIRTDFENTVYDQQQRENKKNNGLAQAAVRDV